MFRSPELSTDLRAVDWVRFLRDFGVTKIAHTPLKDDFHIESMFGSADEQDTTAVIACRDLKLWG